MKQNQPLISIIIPAHNEALTIPYTLKLLQEQLCDFKHEIIVVCDSCEDRTAEAAAFYDAKVVEVNLKNVSKVRNLGIAHAEGDILIIIDADTRPAPNFIESILQECETTDVAYGGVKLKPENKVLISRLRLAIMNGFSKATGLLYGSNVFVDLRKTKGKVYYYDPNFKWGEDVKYTIQMKQDNQKFSFLSDSYVYYNDRKFEINGFYKENWTRLKNVYNFVIKCGLWYATLYKHKAKKH